MPAYLRALLSALNPHRRQPADVRRRVARRSADHRRTAYRRSRGAGDEALFPDRARHRDRAGRAHLDAGAKARAARWVHDHELHLVVRERERLLRATADALAALRAVVADDGAHGAVEAAARLANDFLLVAQRAARERIGGRRRGRGHVDAACGNRASGPLAVPLILAE